MNTFFVSDEILPESVLMTGLGGLVLYKEVNTAPQMNCILISFDNYK